MPHPPIVENRWVYKRAHNGVSGEGGPINVLWGISQEFSCDCLLRKFCPHVQRTIHKSISRQRVLGEKASERFKKRCHICLLVCNTTTPGRLAEILALIKLGSVDKVVEVENLSYNPPRCTGYLVYGKSCFFISKSLDCGLQERFDR